MRFLLTTACLAGLCLCACRPQNSTSAQNSQTASVSGDYASLVTDTSFAVYKKIDAVHEVAVAATDLAAQRDIFLQGVIDVGNLLNNTNYQGKPVFNSVSPTLLPFALLGIGEEQVPPSGQQSGLTPAWMQSGDGQLFLGTVVFVGPRADYNGMFATLRQEASRIIEAARAKKTVQESPYETMIP